MPRARRRDLEFSRSFERRNFPLAVERQAKFESRVIGDRVMGHPARIVLLGGLVIKKQTRRGSLDDRANVRFVRFLIRASRIRGIAIFSRRETKIR